MADGKIVFLNNWLETMTHYIFEPYNVPDTVYNFFYILFPYKEEFLRKCIWFLNKNEELYHIALLVIGNKKNVTDVKMFNVYTFVIYLYSINCI